MSLKKGYLGDPREQAIVWHSGVCKTGVVLEGDGRFENRYSWNGMIIDLCDMPPTGDNSYSTTVFNVSGNASSGSGGSSTPSKVKSQVTYNSIVDVDDDGGVTISIVDDEGNAAQIEEPVTYIITYEDGSVSTLTVPVPQGGNTPTGTAPAPRGNPRPVAIEFEDEVDDDDTTVSEDGTVSTTDTEDTTTTNTIVWSTPSFYYGQYPYLSGASEETLLSNENRTSGGSITDGKVITMKFKIRGGSEEDINSSATDEELEVRYANDFFVMIPKIYSGWTFTIDNGISDETSDFVKSDINISGYDTYISSDITDQLNIFVGNGTEDGELEFKITFNQ